jgi:hypothetical protein
MHELVRISLHADINPGSPICFNMLPMGKISRGYSPGLFYVAEVFRIATQTKNEDCILGRMHNAYTPIPGNANSTKKNIMINSDAPFIFAILLIFGGVLAGVVYEQKPQQPPQLPPVPIVVQLQTTMPVSTNAQQVTQVPALANPQGR